VKYRDVWNDRLLLEDERHCRQCDRELLDEHGRVLRSIFRFPVSPIIGPELEEFDDGKYYEVDYVYCKERCKQSFQSWDTDSAAGLR